MTTVGALAFVGSVVATYVVILGNAGCGQPNLTSGGYYSQCPSMTPELLAIGLSAMTTIVGIVLLTRKDPSASQASTLNVYAPTVAPRLPIFSRRDDAPGMPSAWRASVLTLHF